MLVATEHPLLNVFPRFCRVFCGNLTPQCVCCCILPTRHTLTLCRLFHFVACPLAQLVLAICSCICDCVKFPCMLEIPSVASLFVAALSASIVRQTHMW